MGTAPTLQAPEIPEPTSVWKHTKSGVLYSVTLVTNVLASADRQADYPVTVCYADEEGANWSRPLSRWHEGMVLVSGAK